jgi:hypothetical protein
MSLETKTFCTFGRKYRTRQYSAVKALRIMKSKDALHPCEVLCNTEIFDEQWSSLADEEVINDHIIDVTGTVAPMLILEGIMAIVRNYNFGFIVTWKGTKIPQHFAGDAKSVNSEHVEPMIQQLVQDGLATLRELEEYYSLEDAYKLFDISVVKSVNSAYAHDAAMRSAKSKQR